jgi:hypothetical protein
MRGKRTLWENLAMSQEQKTEQDKRTSQHSTTENSVQQNKHPSEAELQARYLEQLQRMSCPGCGEGEVYF